MGFDVGFGVIMYIVNPKSLKNTYTCGKHIAEYLRDKCGFPILSKDGETYYFSKTEELKDALEKVPLLVRFLESIGW